MLLKELTGDLVKRLSTIKGQIEGIIKMIEEEKEPDQILNQFKAADQGLQKAHYLLMDEVFRKSLALKLVQVMNACPGNCQDAEKIEYMKEQFPMLEFDQLTTQIKEVNAIDKRLEKHNKNNLNKDLEDTPPAT
ncbi:MAG: metal-sensitive transcriptional regulator [Sediminibacterium sp. Gen4]|jgi:CsoR family transcriptional regulator, copper-sensing transcriptional repressor|uniref:metal-sensitive transcriptional regulator n=1 Tax=unclassified Sediminibacterium TaxID=2635961 RepID=UPI0015C0CA81|nr:MULTISPECIES: metal-sensitive transcriptional regulator [unclassified Sediminibacterium]MBW0161617.1 metal-sensitive transcriptional regulator [Sediminibacterium sp.]MBW0164216.1 metal-sensitive transcriptional regulator [Sediminibacterium sp.]NWK65492.1 metal-sensitive transcriptional regulator [Sediminibacterium sp. Gen4]HET9056305.1 metal-sensitive transcriptional regulator [Chitinophagaceae bacterium]